MSIQKSAIYNMHELFLIQCQVQDVIETVSLLEFESRMVVTKGLLERKESQGWLPRNQIESFRYSVALRGHFR